MMGLSAPLKVDFNITNRCNYHCNFCYVPSSDKKGREMNLSEIDKLLSELNNLNVLAVNISGGEPLIRNDILDILNIIKKYDFYYSLNTNGALVTDAIIKKIADTKFEFVSVSLDSAYEEIYNKNRGTKSGFRKMTNGIKKLVSAGINVTGGITLTKYNISTVVDTVYLAAELGMGSIGLQFICPNNEKALKVMPSYDEWRKCFLELTVLQSKHLLPINVSFNTTNESPIPWEMYLPLQETKQLHLLEEVWDIDYKNYSPAETVSCSAGYYSCAIASNGDVYGCEMFFPFEKLKAGNALSEGFRTIWERNFRYADALKKTELKGNCRKCEMAFCGGGCRGAAYFYDHDIKGSDMRCPLAATSPASCPAAHVNNSEN
jgi:radical SAM protein with 4Fe4S-binding SPASM domain